MIKKDTLKTNNFKREKKSAKHYVNIEVDMRKRTTLFFKKTTENAKIIFHKERAKSSYKKLLMSALKLINTKN